MSILAKAEQLKTKAQAVVAAAQMKGFKVTAKVQSCKASAVKRSFIR